MPRPERSTPDPSSPRLWLVRDDFIFSESYNGRTVMVHVRKTTVEIHDVKGLIAAGIWDPGHYVRYARSLLVAELVHPFLLDKIDKTCRKRIALSGVPAERVPPPGKSR
jgi:hypothetical protein